MTVHIVWHELEHILDYSGLNDRAEKAINKQFCRSGSWKSCFRSDKTKGSVSQTEIIADQIAFWATGNRDVRSGCDVPPLVSRARMQQLMRRWFQTATRRVVR